MAAKQIVEFSTDKRFVRRARELKMIGAMLRLYCSGHGHPKGEPLCTDCAELLEYSTRRLERCVFGDSKPTCTNCLVHCYSVEQRERIREVMRWAGPRMTLRHPVLAFLHLLDGRRPAPMLPAKQSKRSAEPPASD